jgi:hypothetical protein
MIMLKKDYKKFFCLTNICIFATYSFFEIKRVEEG